MQVLRRARQGSGRDFTPVRKTLRHAEFVDQPKRRVERCVVAVGVDRGRQIVKEPWTPAMSLDQQPQPGQYVLLLLEAVLATVADRIGQHAAQIQVHGVGRELRIPLEPPHYGVGVVRLVDGREGQFVGRGIHRWHIFAVQVAIAPVQAKAARRRNARDDRVGPQRGRALGEQLGRPPINALKGCFAAAGEGQYRGAEAKGRRQFGRGAVEVRNGCRFHGFNDSCTKPRPSGHTWFVQNTLRPIARAVVWTAGASRESRRG